MPLQWIIGIATNHDVLVYGVIFVIAFVEGPILGFLLGILLRLGYFDPFAIFGIMVAADLLGDIMWYYVGYHYGFRFVNRFGKYVGATEDVIKKVEAIFHRHKTSILFVAKLTNGFGLVVPLFITAGIVRIPFVKYLAANIAGEVIWSSLLLLLGYYFGHFYITVNNIFARMSLGAIIICLIALFIGVRKYVRSKTEQLSQEDI